MIKLIPPIVAVFIAAATLLINTAQAELLSYSFTTPEGEEKSLTSDAVYANPTGEITFKLSAGIDRKVKVSVLTEKGAPVAVETTGVIGAGDRIQQDGKSYYGKTLRIASPSDGRYRLKVDTLSAANKIVQSDAFDWVVDTAPPQANPEMTWINDAGLNGSIKMIGSGTQSIKLEGIRDGVSGIDRVSVYTTDKNLNTKIESAIPLDSNNAAYLNLYGNRNKQIWFPNDDTPYEIAFRVVDRSGNELVVKTDSWIDMIAPIIEYSDVWNKAEGKWVPYTQNMVIDDNPSKVRLKTHKNNIASENINGAGFLSKPNSGVHLNIEIKGDTAYLTAYSDYHLKLFRYTPDTYYNRISTASGSYLTLRPGRDMTVVFSDLAVKAPKGNPDLSRWMLQYQVNGSDAWLPNKSGISSGWEKDFFNEEFTITGLRFNISERVTYPVFARGQMYTYDEGTNSNRKDHFCIILPGDLSCEIENTNIAYSKLNVQDSAVTGTNIYFDEARLKEGKLASSVSVSGYDLLSTYSNLRYGAMLWTWDFNPPIIENVKHDKTKKTLKALFNETDGLESHGTWRLGFIHANGYAIKADGSEIKLKQTYSAIVNKHSLEREFTYKDLADGVYTLKLWGKDRYEHEAEYKIENVIIDTTPPAITINGNPEIQSLDEISIALSDNVDKSPVIESIRLQGGPTGEDVNLAWRSAGDGLFAIEYPVMFPTMGEGETYPVTVTARDVSGNTASETVVFSYKPLQVKLHGVHDGKIMIPAIDHEFSRADGKPILYTDSMTLMNGTRLARPYDVYASLRGDAEVPLVVNGVALMPGETKKIARDHDFRQDNARLGVGIQPLKSGVVGSSKLLLMTSAPNASVIVADINTWQGSATFNTKGSWEVRQIIDPIKISVSPSANVHCRFTTNEEDTKASDPMYPLCLLVWDKIPDETQATLLSNNGLIVPGIVGRAARLGDQTIEYSLYMYDVDGSKHKIGAGSQKLTVIPAATENLASNQEKVTFTPRELGTINRVITDIDLRMEQTSGPTCIASTDADYVKRNAAQRTAENTSYSCLLSFQDMPEGLDDSRNPGLPILKGSLAKKGNYPLIWRVSVFSQYGEEIVLSEQSKTLEAVDPEAPSMEFISKFHFKDDLYMVPLNSTTIGTINAYAAPASLDVSVLHNNAMVEGGTFHTRSTVQAKLILPIPQKAEVLWKESVYRVNVGYHKIPGIKSTQQYRAYSTPSDDIEPIIEIRDETATNIKKLPVTVFIRDRKSPEAEFDKNTMGSWKVRLLKRLTYGKFEALTEFAEAKTGQASFDVDLSGIDGSSVRLVAEAVLDSPVEGYSRIKQSPRPVYMKVLRGGAIKADIVSRRLSGKAPMKVSLRLSLDNNQDIYATESVTWEISNDEGKTWDKKIITDRTKFYLGKTFEKGEYKVRANIRNKNSGEASYTETVDVVAYNDLDVAIEGPKTIFVGTETTFTAQAFLHKTETVYKDVVVDWSLDQGKTYTHTGPEIKISSETADRIRLQARIRPAIAPEDDRYAYEDDVHTVDIKPVKAPRSTYMSGPRRIEVGKTYTYKARSRTPYNDMDVELKGQFTLPDGTVVEGNSVDYTPKAEDLDLGATHIIYTVWIAGYRDQGAETATTMKLQVWKYQWPSFALSTREDSRVAPSKIAASIRAIRPKNALDELTYEWTLPASATVTQDTRVDKRTLEIAEPGDYVIKVTATDKRGNKTVKEEKLHLSKAEPYVIELKYSASNKQNREPLKVTLRPYIRGGHPEDTIREKQFFLNGELLEITGSYPRMVLNAGDYAVKMSATSAMGEQIEQTIDFTVEENHVPNCELSRRETSSTWLVYATCKDSDGTVRSHEWIVDGEPRRVTSRRISVYKTRDEEGNYERMPEVSHVAVDDAGGKSEVSSIQ